MRVSAAAYRTEEKVAKVTEFICRVLPFQAVLGRSKRKNHQKTGVNSAKSANLRPFRGKIVFSANPWFIDYFHSNRQEVPRWPSGRERWRLTSRQSWRRIERRKWMPVKRRRKKRRKRVRFEDLVLLSPSSIEQGLAGQRCVLMMMKWLYDDVITSDLSSILPPQLLARK